jgi:Flp pilus assembly protein TadG
MIEFALILPILLLFLFGIIEISILYSDQYVLNSASREGARYGIALVNSSYPTTAQVISYTTTFCQNNLFTFNKTPPAVTVTATPSASPPVSGSTLKVTVTYTYQGLVLYKLMNIAENYNLSASTTMVYQ